MNLRTKLERSSHPSLNITLQIVTDAKIMNFFVLSNTHPFYPSNGMGKPWKNKVHHTDAPLTSQ